MEETKYVVTVMGTEETQSGVGDIYYFDSEEEAKDFYNNQMEYIANSSGDINMNVMLSEVKNSKVVYEVFYEDTLECLLKEHIVK